MSANTPGGPPPGAYRALATLAFALCFSVWGLVAPLAPRFQELYELSSFQISVVIATPVILGFLFRIPLGLITDRLGGRVVFPVLMLVLIVPVVFIGFLGGSFGGLLFWGSFLGLGASSSMSRSSGGARRVPARPRKGESSSGEEHESPAKEPAVLPPGREALGRPRRAERA
jgi:MFS family permease